MTEFWIQENDKYMLNDLCNIIDGRGNRGQACRQGRNAASSPTLNN